MAINGIPEVLNDYNAYLSGNRLVGTTGEVKLPDLEGLTETIKGCGILGEFETVITGRYGDMEQEIIFNMLSEDVFKMIDTTKAVELVLRGSQHPLVTGSIQPKRKNRQRKNMNAARLNMTGKKPN